MVILRYLIFIFRNDAGVFMRPYDSDPLPFFLFSEVSEDSRFCRCIRIRNEKFLMLFQVPEVPEPAETFKFPVIIKI
jgi:hypothetical protein